MASDDTAASGLIELGHVLGAFGLRGELRLFLHHRESVLLERPVAVMLRAPDGRERRGRLVARSGAGKRILGRFDGLSDCDAADALAGWRILVAPADLPPPALDEFYVWQLEGARVRVDGVDVGEVLRVDNTPGMDVLVIDTADGVRFVPCLKALVEAMDLDARTLDLVPHAFDEDADDEPTS